MIEVPPIDQILTSLAVLVGLVAATSVLSWPLLHLSGLKRPLGIVALNVLYHLAVYRLIPGSSVMIFGPFYLWLHLGFVFRHLSSAYHYRKDAPAPTFGYYVTMMLVGPKQSYGAGSWQELRGERFSLKLLGQWARYMLYSAIVVLAALGLMQWMVAARSWPVPLRELAIRGAWFIIGLEALTFLAHLQTMLWSLGGYHQRFFNDFAWIRARHIGQWWQHWNTWAIRAFAEYTRLFGLRRRYFLNTMVVFLISGFFHQLLVLYCIRRVSYGTMLAFVIHGLLVYLFGRLHHARKRLPVPVRILLLNPVTSAVVTMAAGIPFVLDFYGEFVLDF